MPIPLSQLAAFVTPGPNPAIGANMWQGLANTINDVAGQRENARQADMQNAMQQAQLRALQERHAQDLQEQQRAAMAAEEQARQQAAAQLAVRQAGAKQHLSEMAASGAPPQAVRQEAEAYRSQGIDVSERMTPGSAGQAAQPARQIQRQLAAFSPMMGGPIMSEAKPAVPAVAPQGTGVLDIKGGGDMTLDIPKTQAEQMEQRRPLAAFAGQLGTPGIDRRQYEAIGKGILETPGLTPESSNKILAQAGLQDANNINANLRASQVRALQSEKAGQAAGALEARQWDMGRRAMNQQMAGIKMPELHRNITTMADGLEKLKMSNGILTNQVAFNIVKANGVGQMSNQEFVKSVGGEDIATVLQNWWSTKTVGDLSPQMKSRFQAALLANYKLTKDNMQRAYEQGRKIRDNMPLGMQGGGTEGLRTLFGDFDFYDPSEGGPAGDPSMGGMGESSSSSSGVSLGGPPAAEAMGLIPAPELEEGDEVVY